MPSLTNGFIQSTLRAVYSDGYSGTVNLSRTASLNFSNGSGAGQANRVYTNSATTTIAASGTLSLELSGVLTDAFGNTLTLTLLRALFIEHLTTTTASYVTIGAGSNPVFGTKIANLELYNGDHFMFTCKNGYTITPATADILRIVNADASNAATVRITILASQ